MQWCVCEMTPAPLTTGTEVPQNVWVGRYWCWQGLKQSSGEGACGARTTASVMGKCGPLKPGGGGFGASKLSNECWCCAGSCR